MCVDASVAVKWVLPEEHAREAFSFYEDAATSQTEAIAPPHLPVEVANAVWRKVARELISLVRSRIPLYNPASTIEGGER